MNRAVSGQKASTWRLQAWLAGQRMSANIAPDAGRPVSYAWDQDEACLLVDCSGLLGSESLHAVSDWASGLLTMHCNDNLFEEGCVTDLGLPFGPHPDIAFQQWFATIPGALAEPLTQLPSGQYALARSAQRAPSVRDLILSNVNLCYLLHQVASERGYPEQRLAEIAARKQTEILREIGLPPHKRVVKLVRKIALDEFDPSGLSSLFRVLGDEALCNALVHEARLSRRLFQVLARYPWMAGRPLQRLLCEAPARTHYEWIEDSIRMGGEEAVQAMQGFDRIAQLRRLHDRLIAAQMQQDRSRLRRYDQHGKILPFPPAPFADNDWVQAITTPDALQSETEEMMHCVSSYSERIYNGRYAVYQVLVLERLTLGLKIRDGHVSFDQLQGVANQRPSAAAHTVVDRWLHACLEASLQEKVSAGG